MHKFISVIVSEENHPNIWKYLQENSSKEELENDHSYEDENHLQKSEWFVLSKSNTTRFITAVTTGFSIEVRTYELSNINQNT